MYELEFGLPLYSDSIIGIETSDLHLFLEVVRVLSGSVSKSSFVI